MTNPNNLEADLAALIRGGDEFASRVGRQVSIEIERLTRVHESDERIIQQQEGEIARLRNIVNLCPVCCGTCADMPTSEPSEPRHTLDCDMVKHPCCTNCNCGSSVDTNIREPPAQSPQDGVPAKGVPSSSAAPGSSAVEPTERPSRPEAPPCDHPKARLHIDGAGQHWCGACGIAVRPGEQP
jgi:hypothetical protein